MKKSYLVYFGFSFLFFFLAKIFLSEEYFLDNGIYLSQTLENFIVMYSKEEFIFLNLSIFDCFDVN